MKRVTINLGKERVPLGADAWLQVDSPKGNAIFDDDAEVHCSGRVSTRGVAASIFLLVKYDVGTEDVVKVVPIEGSGQSYSDDADLIESHLEFSFMMAGNVRRLMASLSVDGKASPAIDISMATVFKVQRGAREHLFLDNDTNRSVEQFTGALLLDEKQRRAWHRYAAAIAGLDSPELNCRLLICPAKEEVFQDLYPHRRATVCSLDQVLAICAGPQLIFPSDALRRERDSAYSTVDTHWSDFGARIGATEFLRSVGLGAAVTELPTDFYPRKVYGDLGGKVDGGQIGVFMALPRDYPFSDPVFDNGIGNHGRVWVYVNDDAIIERTLVIFGDSFSVSLSAILASVFKRVVYCYTAAGLDPEVLEAERPGYVLAQTNQRFIINAPGPEASLFRQVEQKSYALSPEDRKSLRDRFPEDCAERYYAQRMRALLA